jgi:hypothetical protein
MTLVPIPTENTAGDPVSDWSNVAVQMAHPGVNISRFGHSVPIQ